MTKNAVDVLTTALRMSEKTQYHGDVEQKLALAFAPLGGGAERRFGVTRARPPPRFRSRSAGAS